jgi:hypothetical protein
MNWIRPYLTLALNINKGRIINSNDLGFQTLAAPQDRGSLDRISLDRIS